MISFTPEQERVLIDALELYARRMDTLAKFPSLADEEPRIYEQNRNIANDLIISLSAAERSGELTTFEAITRSPMILALVLSNREQLCDMCAARSEDYGKCGGPYNCPNGVEAWLQQNYDPSQYEYITNYMNHKGDAQP